MAVALLSTAILHGDTLTLYSHRHYDSDKALFKRFTELTGHKVEVVKAKADELIERLKSEGDRSTADILIASDAGRLHRAKAAGLLKPVLSPILEERIPASHKDPENHWFGFTERARVFAYAPDRISADELSTYEALADKSFRGRIVIRSSANIYNQSLLASMIAAHGQKEARNWATQVRENMARPPQGSDRDQIRAVAAGLADLAVVNTYYYALLLNSDSEKDRKAAKAVRLFFPNNQGRGTHINVSGAGITKASKNVAAATQFLEFLASDEAQKSFPITTYEYPVVDNIEWSDQQKDWGAFKRDPLNLDKLGALNAEAVRTFNQAGWE